MYSKTIVVAFLLISVSCKNSNSQPWAEDGNMRHADTTDKAINENPYPRIAAIPAPAGYKRIDTTVNSFSRWLGNIRLKKNRTVHLYDGTKKQNQSAQFAVLDVPVGNKDLQQCADAVMRLRASYLYDRKQFDSIVFYDNDGKAYRFSAPFTYEHLDNYLQQVFGMCGTASLSKQLKKINFSDIRPGDVFIRGGFPGHAVIVTDVVMNATGDRKYMLAQSYMPAQEIHLLLNPSESGTPWYDVTDDERIETPEYMFYSFELKRW